MLKEHNCSFSLLNSKFVFTDVLDGALLRPRQQYIMLLLCSVKQFVAGVLTAECGHHLGHTVEIGAVNYLVGYPVKLAVDIASIADVVRVYRLISGR